MLRNLGSLRCPASLDIWIGCPLWLPPWSIWGCWLAVWKPHPLRWVGPAAP